MAERSDRRLVVRLNLRTDGCALLLHLERIYARLGVEGRTGAVGLALDLWSMRT